MLAPENVLRGVVWVLAMLAVLYSTLIAGQLLAGVTVALLLFIAYYLRLAVQEFRWYTDYLAADATRDGFEESDTSTDD